MGDAHSRAPTEPHQTRDKFRSPPTPVPAPITPGLSHSASASTIQIPNQAAPPSTPRSSACTAPPSSQAAFSASRCRSRSARNRCCSSSNLPSSVAPPMRRLARLYHLLLHVFDCAAVGEQHLVGVLH